MVSEIFKVYFNENLLDLLDHPLSDYSSYNLSYEFGKSRHKKIVLEISHRLDIKTFYNI